MSQPLSHLLATAGLPPLAGQDVMIDAVTADSRAVRAGMLFVALAGTKVDGRKFIPMAVSQGAAAVLAPTGTEWPADVPPRPLILADSPRHVLALMAATLAGPQPPALVAVTGTNGKTSTTDFIRQLWTLQGYQAAGIGTLGLTGATPVSITLPALTTPDPVSLANTLAALEQHGVHHVALEASSHGLEQDRLDGLQFSAAGFTNLTRDHLDYHGTMAAYRDAKLRLFSTLVPQGGLVAANADMDPETLHVLRTIAHDRAQNLRLVGENGDSLRLIACTPTPAGQELTLECDGDCEFRSSSFLIPPYIL